jgi:tRNA A22 N-methylase
LIEEKSPLLKVKLQMERDKYTKVLETLNMQDTENASIRQKEIVSELNILKEVLECL